MDMPNFEDFRELMTADKIGELFGEYLINVYQTDLSNPQNLNALVSKIALDIMARSAAYSLDLLEEYHKWLAEQVR